MKHLITSIFLLLSFFSSFAFSLKDNKPNKQNVDIVKQPTMPSSDINPLSLIEPDIEAYYCCGAITFTFNVDFGYADIVVRNVATGDEWYDSVSGYGSTSITLNGDSGYYEVTIYTDNGDYIGNFII